MTNKNLYLLTVSLLISAFTPNTLARNRTRAELKADKLTTDIFGHNGIHVKFSHQEEIERLLQNLFTATDYQKQKIAEEVGVYRLPHEIADLHHLLDGDTNKDPSLNNALFILEIQKGYLVEYAESLNQKLSWFEKLQGIILNWYDKVTIKLWGAKDEKPFILKTADELDFYLHFEADHIFNDYQKTLTYLAHQTLYPLPEILRFWKNEKVATELLEGIKAFDQTVRIQLAELGDAAVAASGDLLETTVDLVVEKGLQEGAEEVSKQVAKEAAADAVNEAVGNTVAEELGDEGVDNLALEGADTAAADAVEEDVGENLSQRAARRAERQAARAERRAAAAERIAARNEQEAEMLAKGSGESMVTKAWICVKQFFRWAWRGTFGAIGDALTPMADTLTDYVFGPVEDAYQSAIYKTIIGPMEKGAGLKAALEELPPFTRLIVTVTGQMSIMMGGGLVITWIDAANEKTYAAFAVQQKKMAGINTRIMTQSAIQKLKRMKTGYDTFNKGLTAIGTDKIGKLKNVSMEQTYVQQAMVNTSPPENFIIEGSDNESVMEIDQRFSLSAMLAPDNMKANPLDPASNIGHWHNIFRSGRWEYFPSFNGFYQMQRVPITGTTPLEKAGQALYNSIFREYIPSAGDSYKIEVNCKLLSHEDEFFMGVIFNNARWISGVPDRYHQHRFTGLFGTDGHIYKVFAESGNNDGDNKPNTLWPVYKMLSNPTEYTQADQEISLSSLPASFKITITTAPYNVAITINPTSSATRATSSTPINVNNLAEQIFKFHGIGFMSAGCTTQFTLIEPKELTYTSSQVEKFKTFIGSK